jgi:hypothetical protein
MAMETLVLAPAAKRGVDIAIDQLVAAAKYVGNIWSAYGKLSGDAQDIAAYVKHATWLLESINDNPSVSLLSLGWSITPSLIAKAQPCLGFPYFEVWQGTTRGNVNSCLPCWLAILV